MVFEREDNFVKKERRQSYWHLMLPFNLKELKLFLVTKRKNRRAKISYILKKKGENVI